MTHRVDVIGVKKSHGNESTALISGGTGWERLSNGLPTEGRIAPLSSKGPKPWAQPRAGLKNLRYRDQVRKYGHTKTTLPGSSGVRRAWEKVLVERPPGLDLLGLRETDSPRGVPGS